MTIIGIAGGSGSGKTTVVKRIAKALPPHCVAVVPIDSYYNDTTGMTPEERRAINFDHPDAFDWKLLTEQINMLRRGQAIEQPTYSYVESNRQKGFTTRTAATPSRLHLLPVTVLLLSCVTMYWWTFPILQRAIRRR